MMLGGMVVAGLLDNALKGAALLIIAAVTALVMRRSSAAARHLLWSVTVSGLVLLPLVSLLTPRWRVLPSFPANEQPSEQGVVVDDAAAERIVMELTTSPTTIASTGNAPVGATAMLPPQTSAPQQAQLIPWLWLLGFGLTFAVIFAGLTRVRMLARRARVLPNGAIRLAVGRIAQQYGVNQVQLLEGDAHTMPMTWGVLRRTLLLPSGAEEWPVARLNAVLRHELAHIRRRDSLWQLVAETACALHWFNPFAWYAARRMRIEREHACDDEVLNAGSRASEYASELLSIARSLRCARATSFAAIAMARPRQLEGRLLAVLDEQRSRASVARRWPAWFLGALVLVMVAILHPSQEAAADLPTESEFRSAAAELVANGALEKRSKFAPRAPSKKVLSGAPPQPYAVRTSAPPARAEAPAAIAVFVQQVQQQQQRRCGTEKPRNVSIHTHDDDNGSRQIKWQVGKCRGSIDMRGTVRLSDDVSGFSSITRNGSVAVFEDDGSSKRQVKIRPDASGRLQYDYQVDGDQRAFNGEGRAWLASVLNFMVLQTGFAADERVDYLLRTEGPSGVLAVVEQQNSDYVQRLYLTKLVDKTRVNEGALESILQTAARVLESDYEKTQVLTNIAQRYQLDERALGAYLATARTMQSDYEKRRAFSTILKRSDLDPTDVAAVLDATAGMSSDYERATILKMLPSSNFADAGLQQSYVQAAAAIDSDYELRGVLTTLMKKTTLSSASMDLVLTAAGSIESDYEKAELLLHVLRSQQLTPAQRRRVIKLTDALSSDHERGRVSAAIVRQLSQAQ